ncbi:RNA dependent RNA polymerase [Diaporthe ambigua RNA virus 1]|uniref:RNA dependent RNA polymerase n=1 Tax=Diaporthe ambigua RNA virus 1 TaxID=111470 RepID=UPI00000F0484|nr:RNA dependent RNA polymerase [Diaporthe ambigua RNA virus 1]AAF22958.1 RNA dependent RNA polymerase [Diaporthe ambigua RNA virus 1]
MFVPFPLPCEGTWLPQVHRVCPHNEVGALCRRVLAPLPAQVQERVSPGFSRAMGLAVGLARFYTQPRWSLERTALSYDGALRRRYLGAMDSLLDWPLDVGKDSRLDCFLKAEKLNTLIKRPKPRLIFPRSPRYNLVLASRLKPFEHWLWSHLTAERLGTSGRGRYVAKGLNLSQRARLIVKKMAGFSRCAVLEVDGKAFEAHVGPSSIEQEHRVYKAAYPGDSTLSSLLRAQRVLKGRLPCGAKFSRNGGRASGDFNTGMGNSLIMFSCVYASLVELGYSSWDFLCDGDNALLFVESSDVDDLVERLPGVAVGTCGQELSLDAVTGSLSGVVFGQSKPVFFPSGWRLVRDPFKALSGFGCSHAWLREPKFRDEYLVGVARCELALSLGQPLLQAFCLRVLALFPGVVPRDHVAFRDYEFLGVSPRVLRRPEPVTWETRVSFADAFSISPERQLEIESSFDLVRPSGFLASDAVDSFFGADPGMAEKWFERWV